jgi:hypothetical protein
MYRVNPQDYRTATHRQVPIDGSQAMPQAGQSLRSLNGQLCGAVVKRRGCEPDAGLVECGARCGVVVTVGVGYLGCSRLLGNRIEIVEAP